MLITKTCSKCSAVFEITDSDQEFYNRFKVSVPTLCPHCRSLRRLAYRNERFLYSRKCDLTGENIISIYSTDKPFPVYSPEAWYGDKWDGIIYGMNFDFNRSFFEQYKELRSKVPRMSVQSMNLENSPYVSQCWYVKNCYLCVDVGFAEDCYYCYTTYHSRNVIDCTFTRNCEISYELLDCKDCYSSQYLQDCTLCRDSLFSFDCHSCSNVAFCFNLRNKNYHIFNKPVSPEEFNNFIAQIKNGSHEALEKAKKEYMGKIYFAAVRRENHNINTENCAGDYLIDCKNCQHCYDGENCENLKYCNRLDEKIYNSMDIDHAAIAEFVYEGTSISGNNNCFGLMSLYSHDLIYFDTLKSCHDCFGCVGLKDKQYCILNKQYSKEEYMLLVPKIIEYMKKTGEWGEFPPMENSFYGYNESAACQYAPLTREEAIKKNLPWKDDDPKEYSPQTYKIPDNISAVDEKVISEILACESCKKNYKIILEELKFYKKHNLPLPRKCWNCRHYERLELRTPRKQWKRKCTNCEKEIFTSYSPEKNFTVYCEDCYRQKLI